MAIQEQLDESRARAVEFADPEERLLASLRLSELDAGLQALKVSPLLIATVSAAAETVVSVLKGLPYRVGVFAGDGGEIELIVVMPSKKRTLELAFGPDYVRPSLVTATEAHELPKARRPYSIRAYARWLVGA